jgi:hypothetical protein
MKESEIDDIVYEALDIEPRSKLEPHRELILRLRRRGCPYRRIVQILASRCDVHVSLRTLFVFVQRRSRVRSKSEPIAAEIPAPPSARTKLSSEEAAVQREHIRSVRSQPLVVSTKSRAFVYDPDAKPLTFGNTKEEGTNK